MKSLLLFMALCFPFFCISQGENRSETAGAKSATRPKNDIKSFRELIPEGSKLDSGLFTLHFVEDKIYYEIPYSLLQKDMLWVTRFSQIPANLSGYLNAGSSVNEQVVHWVKKDKTILLKSISFRNVAADSLPIYRSVRYNNFEPILEAFKIEAFNADSTGVLIDISAFYSKDVPAFSGLNDALRKQFKVSRLDPARSFIDTVRSFPINVEVTHTLTYAATEPPSNAASGTISTQMNQSMILLPEKPMKPRLHDPRVGWFTVAQIDYGSEALKSDEKRFIRRWRLEPKDPVAYARGQLVEPVKPIVYYLDPATPIKWRPYFKKGIEDWQKAFEAAGFKNAIIAKDPPSYKEDPDFNPEDARYSVVRYVASTTRNAVGPSVSDPRTGEIIESDIIWYHNHLRSYRNRYMLETGAANSKARNLNTPDEEIGEMMRRVISHEIGHALGLPHNMKASSAYSVDSLRSGTFTQKYGIASTIMDYARYNYVAQPGDKGIRFVRQMGPYDFYAINWGYRYLANAATPEEEKRTLHQWILEKKGDPMYMFGSGNGGYDPNSQTECIGDNAMKASSYGVANLKKVVPELLHWTTTPGEGYSDLSELYEELIGVWSRYCGHVLTNIGGVYETLKSTDQEGSVYEPVPVALQKEAMKWMIENVFETPEWLLDPAILSRIRPAGARDNLIASQSQFLSSLLNTNRLQRIQESYTLLEMMKDLYAGIWKEASSKLNPDQNRRALQRAYLQRIQSLMNTAPAGGGTPGNAAGSRFDVGQSDIQAVARFLLKKLTIDLEYALSNTADEMTQMHWLDCRERVEEILAGSK